MSPKRRTWRTGLVTAGNSGGATFSRILHRASVLLPLLACLAILPSTAYAQEERPQITPEERKAPRKKDAGPRAVAVLQLAPNGKASLVPIAILINGKFWDASAYKADPVPMALDPGNVYEVEQAGSPLGLFTVNNALHSNAQNTAAPWLGTGQWRPAGTEEPTKVAHTDPTPVGIDNADGPPRLTHDTTKKEPVPAGDRGTAASTPSPASKPSPSSSSGDEPPRLSKPSGPATPPTDSTAGKQPDGSVPSPGGDSRGKDAKPGQESVPASDSGTSEANRPRLRRGKPAESFGDDDVPGYSKPGAASGEASRSGKIKEASAASSDIKLIPAISDAGGPPPHSFKFEWLKGEEEDRRKQMMDLAKEQLRAYLAAHAKTPAAQKAVRTAAGRKVTSPEPIIENAQMTAYDLWNSNQPIIIFTAGAHLPPPPAGAAHPEVQSELEYSICLGAYPDTYNNLHKLYSAITDRFHLDVTPRLELVDAVDADGDGRGELLFRQTSDLGMGWIIYRATGDKFWKIFDSLNPE
ncbi:MAG TPA: hypothetical protein VFA67_19040 [Candidatus Sulfotelmatobacter sp.]|nr:hypothetical protein [Candidatus Sulfotelmatobacter sp.]